MAYITKSRNNLWEIRQSYVTANGPRSKTLATFDVLDDETIARATTRSVAEVTAEELVRSARRAGAPVRTDPARHAAGELLSAIANGATLPPVVALAVADAVGRQWKSPANRHDARALGALSDALKSASRWAGAEDRERAEALVDLLLLADALPTPRTPVGKSFPRFVPARA